MGGEGGHLEAGHAQHAAPVVGKLRGVGVQGAAVRLLSLALRRAPLVAVVRSTVACRHIAVQGLRARTIGPSRQCLALTTLKMRICTS